MNDERVEALARWIHETWLRLGTRYTNNSRPWQELRDDFREQYRIIAQELLTNPPACLAALPEPLIVKAGQ